MLSLKGITKEYVTGGITTHALRGIDVTFRQNEFVAILGPSGCGKTTLLNIVGGLDRYTTGDLVVRGRSTKDFSTADWDAYRNRTIGFVFQSYNLIPHQSVLANVELAMTLSGVSRGERRRRAIEALKSVGLSDQLHKRPNQMSGGQMQRVAIARALVNNPDVLLADEPTGALDSETSLQIMEILKEVARERLVIMVTHNPDLANEYATRTIRLLDGRVVDDTDPFTEETEEKPQPIPRKKALSMGTALSLSLNNLMTKKARTFLTAFAGSIGIIGIALILSLSNGVDAYIARVEEDTLSNYPLTIERSTVDMGSILTSMAGQKENVTHELDKIYSNNIMGNMMNTALREVSTNDLDAFKVHLEEREADFSTWCSDIKYGYATAPQVFRTDTEDGIWRVEPAELMQSMGLMGGTGDMMTAMPMANSMASGGVFRELLGNDELLKEQYAVVAGRMPQAANELVLMVDGDNEITDYTLYCLGILDPDEAKQMLKDIMAGKEVKSEQVSYSYEELLGTTFRLLSLPDYYEKSGEGYRDMREDEVYMAKAIADGIELKVVGIVRPNDQSAAAVSGGLIGYTPALMEILIERVNQSEIVKAQKADPKTDVFTGKPFADPEAPPSAADFDISTLPPEQQAYLATLTPEEQQALFERYAAASVSKATYEENLAILGVVDPESPSSIMLYPKDFAAKEEIVALIDEYNADFPVEEQIRYTDLVGIIMSSVTTIINAISYILIAFVSISLVVSSIMIGIITYISVLERTKEIGILRSIGASKRDISRVFNAETMIVGLSAGLLGIGVTILLNMLANPIIESLTDIAGLSVLPWQGGVVLVLISMLLTFIAGLIPSRIAARKDPVVALRSE